MTQEQIKVEDQKVEALGRNTTIATVKFTVIKRGDGGILVESADDYRLKGKGLIVTSKGEDAKFPEFMKTDIVYQAPVKIALTLRKNVPFIENPGTDMELHKTINKYEIVRYLVGEVVELE